MAGLPSFHSPATEALKRIHKGSSASSSQRDELIATVSRGSAECGHLAKIRAVEIPSIREMRVAPNDVEDLETSDPERNDLRAIVKRLKEVQRKCAEAPGVSGRGNSAEAGLRAILSELEASLDPNADLMEVEILDLRLATVEEMFEATGSPGVARVLSRIRSSLASPSEGTGKEVEPPPPQRFQPSPTSAVRRRRPRPKTRISPAPAPAPKRRFGWLIVAVLILGAAAVAATMYLQQLGPWAAPPDSSVQGAIERPLIPWRSTTTDSASAPSGSGSGHGIDLKEEDMARFTFEMSLAESSLQGGDINESLRHFAAAAAIDRQHRRVVAMGKTLIAAMLHDADLAYDMGDKTAAGKRLESSRSIARGLQLVGASSEGATQSSLSTVRFEDISPHDDEELARAVGHTVRLNLKTRDTMYGYLIQIRGDLLILDAYSGPGGPGIDSSSSILDSTIREIRVYDVD